MVYTLVEVIPSNLRRVARKLVRLLQDCSLSRSCPRLVARHCDWGGCKYNQMLAVCLKVSG